MKKQLTDFSSVTDEKFPIDKEKDAMRLEKYSENLQKFNRGYKKKDFPMEKTIAIELEVLRIKTHVQFLRNN